MIIQFNIDQLFYVAAECLCVLNIMPQTFLSSPSFIWPLLLIDSHSQHFYNQAQINIHKIMKYTTLLIGLLLLTIVEAGSASKE